MIGRDPVTFPLRDPRRQSSSEIEFFNDVNESLELFNRRYRFNPGFLEITGTTDQAIPDLAWAEALIVECVPCGRYTETKVETLLQRGNLICKRSDEEWRIRIAANTDTQYSDWGWEGTADLARRNRLIEAIRRGYQGWKSCEQSRSQ